LGIIVPVNQTWKSCLAKIVIVINPLQQCSSPRLLVNYYIHAHNIMQSN